MGFLGEEGDDSLRSVLVTYREMREGERGGKI